MTARSFRSAKSLGTGVVVLLGINVVVLAVLWWFRLVERGLIQRAARNELVLRRRRSALTTGSPPRRSCG